MNGNFMNRPVTDMGANTSSSDNNQHQAGSTSSSSAINGRSSGSSRGKINSSSTCASSSSRSNNLTTSCQRGPYSNGHALAQKVKRHTSGEREDSQQNQQLTVETVASMPPPGQAGPSSFAFSPDPLERYLSFLSVSHGNCGGIPPGTRQAASSRGGGVARGNNVVVGITSTGVSTSMSTGSSSERKLCAIDMLPFLHNLGLVPRSNDGRIEEEDGASCDDCEGEVEIDDDASAEVEIINQRTRGEDDDADRMDVSNGSIAEYDDHELAIQNNMGSSGMESTCGTNSRRICPEEEEEEDDDDEVSMIPVAGLRHSNTNKMNSNHSAPQHASDDGHSNCDIPIRNPQSVSRDFVFPLLSSHAGSTLEGESDATLSLEERLRRERQRVHSTGVTQFNWSLHKSNSPNAKCGSKVPKISTDKRSSSSNDAVGRRRTNNGSNNSKPNKLDSSENINVQSVPQEAQQQDGLRILVPLRGNVYVQDGVNAPLRLVYDKSCLEGKIGQHNKTNNSGGKQQPQSSGSVVGRDASAIDAQLSPDGSMVAFVVAGEIYCVSADGDEHVTSEDITPVRLTYGATLESRSSDGLSDSTTDNTCITHGLADFVAQEEMDRYRGFWWSPSSDGIVFTRVDESMVPPYRITHQGRDGLGPASFEDHRYPFAGQNNPEVTLAYITVNAPAKHSATDSQEATRNWQNVTWFDPPSNASEYLARVSWLPDGSVCTQWQDRAQATLVVLKINVHTAESVVLLTERSEVWINLHHMIRPLTKVYSPPSSTATKNQHTAVADNSTSSSAHLPQGSFSFLFASERTKFCHLYLYTYIAGDSSATLVRAVSAGPWIVESIVGVDVDKDIVYVAGTFDSPLERHLYALPLTSSHPFLFDHKHANKNQTRSKNILSNTTCTLSRGYSSMLSATNASKSAIKGTTTSSSFRQTTPIPPPPPDPIRITKRAGMHSFTIDKACRVLVDVSSDLTRPTSIEVFALPTKQQFQAFLNHAEEKKNNKSEDLLTLLFVLHDATTDSTNFPQPEILSFPSGDGTVELHAALYRPDPKIHGNGPYPLACAVYGGPHVQRVHRSYSQCADMRAQRLRSLGFAVVKCDNRGSSRRGLSFEGAIKRKLGRLEVLDQVTAVRHLAQLGIADITRVGVYGWSYGGYLAAMCLCRAPDVFRVAVSGAPVTSWDGYDTHYTERYMGTPDDNPAGYRESAVFDHVGNMRGRLMIVHGLIDENVHFRHTARLVNRLIACGKDYDLLLFPDERHSPRRLRDRIYMEQRISDYFVKHLMNVGENAGDGRKERTEPHFRPIRGNL